MPFQRRRSISQCDVCSSFTVKLIDESEITHVPSRRWSLVYYCTECKSRVGCHPQTTIPLGLMADGYTRKLRADLHDKIDPLWQSGIATRTEIYTWLAKELKLEFQDFHVASLTRAQLYAAMEIATKYYDLNYDRIKKAFDDRRYYKNRR